MKTLVRKYIVQTVTVTKGMQKIHFTVKHPENAEYLTGIAVTSNYVQSLPSGDGHDFVGVLALAIADKGDVFYSELIKIDTGVFSEYVEQDTAPQFVNTDFGHNGKRYEYFETAVPITPALMEGFYEDAVNPNGETIPFYQITLYLRYQMKKYEDRVCP